MLPSRSAGRFARMFTVGWCTFLVPLLGNARPLRVSDLLSTRTIGDGQVALSPDGRLLAYTVIEPQTIKNVSPGLFTATGASRRAAGARLKVVDTVTGAERDLTGPAGVSWAGTWSPDGKQLAFFSDRDGAARLWLWTRENGAVRRVSDAIVHVFWDFQHPAWSAEGGLMVSLLPEGHTLAEFAQWGTPAGHGFEDRVPSAPSDANGKELGTRIWVLRSKEATVQSRPQDAPDPSIVSKLTLSDLALIDVATGTVSRLTRGLSIFKYWPSPQGDAVAVESYTAETRGDIVLADLRLVTLHDRHVETIALGVPLRSQQPMSWSPDGSALAYVPYLPVDGGGDAECMVYSRVTGKLSSVTGGPHPSFADALRGPMWDSSSRSIYLIGGNSVWRTSGTGAQPEKLGTVADRELLRIIPAPQVGAAWLPGDGASLYVQTRDPKTLRVGVASLDLKSRATRILWEEDAAEAMLEGLVEPGHTVTAGDSFAYVRQTASAAPDLWMMDVPSGRRRRITHLNAALDQYHFAGSRLLEWRSERGETIRGALLLPSDSTPGRRYPLIVWLYPGAPLSRNLNYFGLDGDATFLNMQFFATHGYAVLEPDVPQQMGTPMRDIAGAVLPGVNEAIATGIADPERLGIMGHSYGGYSTFATIVQSTRFKAAVAIAPASPDMFGQFSMLVDGSARGVSWARLQGLMPGDPWHYRDLYIENSPFFYFDRVQTPVLIAVGTQDLAVPLAGTDQAFVALRSLGKEVTYVKYENESHTPSDWTAEHQRDFYTRLLGWFDDHLLKGAAQRIH